MRPPADNNMQFIWLTTELLMTRPFRTMVAGTISENLRWFTIATIFFLFGLHPSQVHAWPTTSQWIPIYKSSAYLQDPTGDANGARNIVSDTNNPAVFIFNDGTNLFFRLRLDNNPSGQGGQGALQAFGWGVEFDTNQNAGNYEWLLMLDGISQTEVITLSQNTVQGTLGDPSDRPEILKATIPLSGNYQVSMANTALNGDTDYFLDWQFPFATVKQNTGLTDSSPIRLFFGSSSSANNLSSNGADLVGGSDLYSGFSDMTTPLGTKPATGTVRFVGTVTGSGDVIQMVSGDTLYVRVDDTDRNHNNASLQQLQVTLRAVSGDTAALTLTETQINSGIFTGSIATQSGAPVASDGILQVTPGTTVSVEYIDGVDAAYQVNQIRTDSLYVVSLLPAISLVKAADHATAQPQDEIIYSIHYHNSGIGAATNLIISDTIPLFTTYVPASLKIGNAASTYATATPLTDASGDDAGQINGPVIIFMIDAVAADDTAAGSGSDEGKVYFKVKVN